MNGNANIDGLYELPTGALIDLSAVIAVSPVEMAEWEKYTVTLIGGSTVTLVHNRPVERNHLKREIFVDAWRQYKLAQQKKSMA